MYYKCRDKEEGHLIIVGTDRMQIEAATTKWGWLYEEPEHLSIDLCPGAKVIMLDSDTFLTSSSNKVLVIEGEL
jgi:hypothetical protein